MSFMIGGLALIASWVVLLSISQRSNKLKISYFEVFIIFPTQLIFINLGSSMPFLSQIKRPSMIYTAPLILTAGSSIYYYVKFFPVKVLTTGLTAADRSSNKDLRLSVSLLFTILFYLSSISKCFLVLAIIPILAS